MSDNGEVKIWVEDKFIILFKKGIVLEEISVLVSGEWLRLKMECLFKSLCKK